MGFTDLPSVWSSRLASAGDMSVRVAPLRDSGGFRGLAIYASRASRTRPIANTAAVTNGAPFYASYAQVEDALGTPAVVVWGPGDRILGTMEGARAGLDAIPSRMSAVARSASRLVHRSASSTASNAASLGDVRFGRRASAVRNDPGFGGRAKSVATSLNPSLVPMKTRSTVAVEVVHGRGIAFRCGCV